MINNQDNGGQKAFQQLQTRQQTAFIKKAQKRIQLKNIIIVKFRNKYACANDLDDELNQFIQSKMDEMFSKQMFDERDLIAVDREIKSKYDSIVEQSKNGKRIDRPSQRGQQATLKRLDKMEDLQSA